MKMPSFVEDWWYSKRKRDLVAQIKSYREEEMQFQSQRQKESQFFMEMCDTAKQILSALYQISPEEVTLTAKPYLSPNAVARVEVKCKDTSFTIDLASRESILGTRYYLLVAIDNDFDTKPGTWYSKEFRMKAISQTPEKIRSALAPWVYENHTLIRKNMKGTKTA